MTNRWQVWVIILWIQQGHVLKLWHRFPQASAAKHGRRKSIIDIMGCIWPTCVFKTDKIFKSTILLNSKLDGKEGKGKHKQSVGGPHPSIQLLTNIYCMCDIAYMCTWSKNHLPYRETAQKDVADGGVSSFAMKVAPACPCEELWSKCRQATKQLILRARHKAIGPPTFTSFWRRSSWMYRLCARNSASAITPNKENCIMSEGASWIA